MIRLMPPALRLARDYHLKFDTFPRDVRAHHLTRGDVERALKWPRWVDELTTGPDLRFSETLTVWVAYPAEGGRRNASSVLVVTHERGSDRRVHDAWRVYHDHVDLSLVRSGREALLAFLDRYGVDVRLGQTSRRVFLADRIPMGASHNAEAQIEGVSPDTVVRKFQLLRLAPERAEIDVGAAFAVNESAVQSDLKRHVWHRVAS